MRDNKQNTTTIVAVCGKGGVGKTTISAAIARILLGRPGNVLAIDADPSVGLATALGFTIRKTVDDIRQDLIRHLTSGSSGNREQVVARLDYEIFAALEEKENLAFLAIGRPEGAGCYCQVNELLKDIITAVADNFDTIVIDGEAGIEQVNRRVMERVSHLLLVSDATARGIAVAQTIAEVAGKSMQYERTGLIVNRLREDEEKYIRIPADLPYLGWIPEDEEIRNYNLQGRSILDIPETPFFNSVRDCLCSLGILSGDVPSGKRT
jgi:CO dehydrogenase maturation factor